MPSIVLGSLFSMPAGRPALIVYLLILAHVGFFSCSRPDWHASHPYMKRPT
jgi:hypothetical protein